MSLLIGLSFNLCLADLATEKVSLNKVHKIVTGTKLPPPYDFVGLFDRYLAVNSESPLNSLDSDQIVGARSMLQQLMAKEVFIQPRCDQRLHGFFESPILLWEIEGLLFSYRKKDYTGGYIPLTLEPTPNTESGHWLTLPDYTPVVF
jgi:hypothetical protein